MKPYLIIVFLITALFCSNNASPMSHKRLINVALFLDERGGDIWQAKSSGKDGVILAELKSAIKSSSSFIFVTGSTLQQYSKSKDLEKNFDQVWEIYESKAPKASLFILIPEAYKNKVIAAWKKSKWIPAAKKIAPAESTAALGLNIYDKKHFEKRTIKDIQTKKMAPTSKSVPAITIALVKNKRDKHGGFFNFYITGHGGATTQTERGSIASLSIADYQDLIQFLQKNCSVNLLVVLSCYGGGTHLFTSYPQATQLKFLKRDFLIVHYGTTDNPLRLTRKLNFVEFFQNIEEFEQRTGGVTLETILLSLYSPRAQKSPNILLGNTPYALLPNSQIIVPINIFPEEINFLSYTKVMAHYFADKDIVMKADKAVFLLFPTLIPATMKGVKRGASLLSASPGSGMHFFKEIDTTSVSTDPLDFLTSTFIWATIPLRSKAQKIFIIKKLKYRYRREMKELNNIVLIVPGVDIMGNAIYQLAYEQSVNHTNLYTQAELRGKYSERTRFIMLQGKFQPKVTQKSKYESAKESFDLITNAIKKHTLVGYLETDPQTIRQFPLLAGQKDYRSLIINIASLMDSKLLQERKELTPWDFVWGKVGFLQPPPRSREFGIRYPGEPIAKRREKQKFFQDLSDKINQMLNKELFLRSIALFMTEQEVFGKLLFKASIQQKQITQQQIDALLNAGLELFKQRFTSYSKQKLFERLIHHNLITKKQLATAEKVFSVDQYLGETLLKILINNKLISPQQAETALITAMRWYSEGDPSSGGELLKLLIDNQVLTPKRIITTFDIAMMLIKTGNIPRGLSFLERVTRSKQITQEQIDRLFTTAMTWLSEDVGERKVDHVRKLLEILINNRRITKNDTEKVKAIRDSALKVLKRSKHVGDLVLRLLLDHELLSAEDEKEARETISKLYE